MKAERQHCEYHPPEWLRACEISATYEVGGRWYCGFHKVKGPGVAAAAERRSRDDAACRIVRALAAVDALGAQQYYSDAQDALMLLMTEARAWAEQEHAL